MIVIFSDHIAIDKDQDIGTKHNSLISNLRIIIMAYVQSALELM